MSTDMYPVAYPPAQQDMCMYQAVYPPTAQPGMYTYQPMYPSTETTGMYMYQPMYPPTNNTGMYFMYPAMPTPAGPSTQQRPQRRPDRNYRPNNKNAQGMFLPQACVFVGNLSTQVPIGELVGDLRAEFSAFGQCYVKIKQNKEKNLPGAFVQFEDAAHADAALAQNNILKVHGRRLRIERIKAHRTCHIGLRTGKPIDDYQTMTALRGRGEIDHYSPETTPSGEVYRVTFSYVDDCYDAIKHFENNSTYWLAIVDEPQQDG